MQFRILKYTEAFVICGCETWSHTLSETPRLRFLEIKMLKRIFGPQMKAVTERGRRLHTVMWSAII
jgi:hypothetical protein